MFIRVIGGKRGVVLPPGANLWWETDTTVHPTAVHLTGGNVDTLTDLTGNGNDAVQANPANQPQWIASGNGGVVRFNDPSAWWLGNNTKTPRCGQLFVLAKWTGSPGFTSVNGLFTSWDQTGAAVVHLAGDTFTFSLYRHLWPVTMLPYKDGNPVSNRFFDLLTDWHIYELQDTNPQNMVVGYRLGVLRDQGIYWRGDVAAVVMYPDILTEPLRQQACTYFRELAVRLNVPPPA